MTAKEDLQKLDADITALEQQSSNLSEQTYHLHQQREIVLRQYVLEEKLLSGTVWSARPNSRTPGIFMDSDDKLPDEAMRLLRSGWHSSFELEEGVTIQFDDNDISLTIQLGIDVGVLATKYGLVIKADLVAKQIAHLQAQLATMQKLLGQLTVIPPPTST